MTQASTQASPSGATIPPESQIIDNDDAVWTVVNGVSTINGQPAANSGNVILLLWFGGGIYQQASDGQFYSWDGAVWHYSLDPRLGGISDDGATIHGEGEWLIDENEDIWTLEGGVVYREGEPAGSTGNVTELLWYGGKMYHFGTGAWWAHDDARNIPGEWQSCVTDPRTPAQSAPGTFHGVNGHYDYLYTPDQIVAILKDMGCTTYRVGCWDSEKQINAVTALAKAFQAAGLTLFVLVNQGIVDPDTNEIFTSSDDAYTRGYHCGSNVANALKPYGVTMYECGNELTRSPGIIVDLHYAGNIITDFNNDNWPVMRQVMRGMIDGVMNAQPDARCGLNFCVADTAASDMLWNGTQPDGSSGHQPLYWAFTTWHNYEPYGTIFDIGTDGAGPGFNLPEYVKARYGVPFMMTEWNAAPETQGEDWAGYITQELSGYYGARKQSNIQACMIYVLDSGNTDYGLMINGAPVPASYDSFTGFIAGNPDN